MKQAFFYLLTETSPSFNDCQKRWEEDRSVLLTQQDQVACWLAFRYFQINKSILLLCENESHAQRIDEALWSVGAERFIAHSLVGQGPKKGAGIEICWPDKRSTKPRDILIFLAYEFCDIATLFKSVIDFVPAEESEKTQARLRYKQYREMGFNLKTGPLPATFVSG